MESLLTSADRINALDTEKVVLAMSGGVDSCAAALLLRDLGINIIGVSMQVWDYRSRGGNSSRATCCAPSDFDDARRIAEQKDFPFYVFDFEKSFKKNVIDPFIASYVAGETPNPCMDCNRKVKFRELRQRALQLGCNIVATGHYARIIKKPNGELGLFTARDTAKDQSYFLYALTQDELKSTIFPVGNMQKSDVRKVLAADKHAVSQKAESQDICFVSDSVASFIRSQGVEVPNGQIRRSDGTVIGKHEGIYNFTVGQRKGLGVSHHRPLYVLSINEQEHSVTVGEKDELSLPSFEVKNVTWLSAEPPSLPLRVRAKLRYRHPGVLCEITELNSSDHISAKNSDSLVEGNVSENRVLLTFLDDATEVSPGQIAVFYDPERSDLTDDDSFEVFGGGIICKPGNH